LTPEVLLLTSRERSKVLLSLLKAGMRENPTFSTP